MGCKVYPGKQDASVATDMQVDQEMLFEIILAANYLDIKPLL